MLWAALIFCFLYFSGGSTDGIYLPWVVESAKHQLKGEIRDKERSKKAIKILDEMTRSAKSYVKNLKKSEKQMGKLIKDYNSTREDFNRLFLDIETKREVSTAEILDRLPNLKQNIRKEEWTKAFQEKSEK
ncbi:MAG: hypothetical protein IPN19_01500 [Elusimicrobia bacterium]|nr:hypothetical protein [Elusimicrobiota bacterium]